MQAVFVLEHRISQALKAAFLSTPLFVSLYLFNLLGLSNVLVFSVPVAFYKYSFIAVLVLWALLFIFLLLREGRTLVFLDEKLNYKFRLLNHFELKERIPLPGALLRWRAYVNRAFFRYALSQLLLLLLLAVLTSSLLARTWPLYYKLWSGEALFIHLTHPDYVLEGSPFEIDIESDWPDIQIERESYSQRWRASYSTNLSISNLRKDLRLNLTFTYGALEERRSVFVPFIEKPRIEAIEHRIYNPQSRQWSDRGELKNVLLKEGESVRTLVRFPPSVAIEAYQLKPDLPSSLDENTITIDSSPSSTLRMALIFSNAYGMHSDFDWLYEVQTNRPPQVEWIRPAADVRLEQAGNLTFEWLISDDSGLAKLTVEEMAITPEASNTLSNALIFDTDILPEVYRHQRSVDYSKKQWSPGVRYRSRLLAEDRLGMVQLSEWRSVLPLDRRERSESAQRELENLKEKGESIETAIERFNEKLQWQGKNPDQQRLRALAEENREIRKAIQEQVQTIEKIEKQNDSMDYEKSQALKEQMQAIKDKYQRLDRNFLEQLQALEQRMRGDESSLRREAMEELAQLDENALEDSLDQLDRSLESLLEQQAFHQLEQEMRLFAESFESLRAEAIAENERELYNMYSENLMENLDNVSRLFDQQEESISERIPPDSSMEKNLEELRDFLSASNRSAMRDFDWDENSDADMAEMSASVKQAMEQMQALAKMFQEQNFQALLDELNRQIHTFYNFAENIEYLALPQYWVDWSKSDTERARAYFNELFSQYRGSTRTLKRQLNIEASVFVRNLEPSLQKYDDLLRLYQENLIALDPAQNRAPFSVGNQLNRLNALEKAKDQLIAQLVLLKRFASQQKQQQEFMQQMMQMSSQQSSINQRSRPMMGQQGQAQSQYMKQLAKEQAKMRALLEQLLQGQPGEKQGGSSPSRSEAMQKQMQEIRAKMKELEEKMTENDPDEQERVKKLQDQLLEELKPFREGQLENRDLKEDDEREAKTASESEIENNQNRLDSEKTQTVRPPPLILPPVYRESLDNFFLELEKSEE